MADFSFEGLLGGINNAFSGGSSNYLDEYLTPDQKRMMQRNAMLAASAALLKAGGESTRRIGIGEALGEALQAGQGGYEKAQTGALTQMALKQKMDEAKRLAELQKTIAGVFNQPTPGQEITSDQALAIPGMAAGPTLERAAMIGQPAPAVDAKLQKSNQYARLAEIYAGVGKSEDAARYQKLADDLNPRDELIGGLTQLTDEAGNPIMVQQFKSGKFQTVKGYGPQREIVLQNVGDKVIAVDKNRVNTGKEFAFGMSPAEQAGSLVALEKLGMDRTQLDAKLKNDAARLGIDQRQLALAIDAAGLNREKFDRDAYERVETEGGNLFLVSKTPGGPSFPILGPSPSPGVPGKQLGVGITPIQQANLNLATDQFGLSKDQFGLSKDQFDQKVKQDAAQLGIALQQLGLSKDQFNQKVKQDALSMGIDQQRLGLELKRYNLSAAELAKGNYKVQETENGFVYIPTVPGMPTIPIMSGGKQLKGSSAGGNATEGERKAATLLSRMQLAEQDMGGQGERGMPGIFSSIAPRVMKQEERKRVEDAQLDFLDAALTLATGAAYTEFQLKGAMQSYFPKFGDDAQTIQYKELRVKNLVEAARIAAGRMSAAVPPLPPRPSAPGAGSGRPALNQIFGIPGN